MRESVFVDKKKSPLLNESTASLRLDGKNKFSVAFERRSPEKDPAATRKS